MDIQPPALLRKLDRERWNLTDAQLALAQQMLREVESVRWQKMEREMTEHAPYAMHALFPDEYPKPEPKRRLGDITGTQPPRRGRPPHSGQTCVAYGCVNSTIGDSIFCRRHQPRPADSANLPLVRCPDCCADPRCCPGHAAIGDAPWNSEHGHDNRLK